MPLFNRVSFETPESVELDFTLAGIGSRAYALVIDYLIWGLTLVIFLFAWSFFSYYLSTALAGTVDTDTLDLWLFAIMLLLYFFIYVGYFVFFETVWQGQTPGKRRAKIRVIREDGRPVRLQQATLRALLRPVDDIFFIGALLIFLTKKEKRLGDMVAGTIVIQEERGSAKANFQLSEEAQPLANELLEIAEISSLLPEDFAVIRDYLQRRKELSKDAKVELSKQLASQLKAIINLETLERKVSATVFLEALYLAYQQQIRE